MNILKIILALLPATISAQTTVTEFKPGIAANGVNYALPRTVFNADIHAVKVDYTPGEFAKYAKRYLHIDNVPTESSTHYYVDKIDFYQTGEPDTLKYYTVKLKDKTTAPFVQLSKSGLLLAVNASAEEKERVLPKDSKISGFIDGTQYLTEEILMATSLSKMAELIAEEIMTIRESKNEIKRGQVESMPKDGASLKIVLDELDLQEEALTRLFTGYTDTTYTAQTVTYTPTASVTRDVLFRFSKKLGFVDSDDLAGEPYYISVKDLHSVPIPTPEEETKRKIQGLVYNMPGLATVTVSSLNNVIYEHDIPFAQFGTIDMLNPTLFNKGISTKVIFDPATGGIQKIEK